MAEAETATAAGAETPVAAPASASSATRAAVLAALAESVAALPTDRVALVAVDGVDGAGKTTFGDELTEAVRAVGRPVIRGSVDGFHQPRAVRYQRGRTSPEGFFHDSYDYAALRSVLLNPLRSGDGVYRTAYFDHVTDRRVDVAGQRADAGAVLVFDGIFLHRPELAGSWDFSIFLHAEFAATFARMAIRDGFDPDPAAPSNARYRDGQALYLASCRPADAASVVVDNTDLKSPSIVARRDAARRRKELGGA